MRVCKIIILAAVAWAVPTNPEAGPIYLLVHQSDAFGNTGPSDTVGPQATPIDYDFEYQQTYFIANSNFGEVHANINPGSMGISAFTENKGSLAPQRQEVAARFAFDVIFDSPTNDPISTMLNLDLSGTVNPAFAVSGGVQVFASVNNVGASGHYGEYVDPVQGTILTRENMLAGFVDDGTVNSISTPVFSNIPVNTVVRVEIGLNTFQTYGHGVQSTVDFGSTFNLTRSGDVFTILGPNAGDISVNSEDAGIVDNRFGQASAVPEPSSMALLGIGALGLFGYGRRRSTAPKHEAA